MIKHLWRWHPKVALRYLPVIAKIKKLKLIDKPILEIGSGSLGIVPYLDKQITAVDVNFDGPQTDLMTKIRSSALNLPFNNHSFDVVVMIDVLEHLSFKNRYKAIEEAARVTSKLLIIGVPCGDIARQEDKYLADYYESVYHQTFSFYQDHLKYQLPTQKQMSDTIIEINKLNKRQFTLEIKGNVNIKLHRFLMRGWISKNLLVNLIFRKIFLLFIPLMRQINWEPTYRKLFYVYFRT